MNYIRLTSHGSGLKILVNVNAVRRVELLGGDRVLVVESVEDVQKMIESDATDFEAEVPL